MACCDKTDSCPVLMKLFVWLFLLQELVILLIYSLIFSLWYILKVLVHLKMSVHFKFTDLAGIAETHFLFFQIDPFFFFYFFCILFYFCPCHVACGNLVPRPGIEPRPWQWKHRVLTIGQPGNSLSHLILFINYNTGWHFMALTLIIKNTYLMVYEKNLFCFMSILTFQLDLETDD